MLCKRHCYIMKRQATNWKNIFAKHISEKRPGSRVENSQSRKCASNSMKKMGQNTTKDGVRMAGSLTRRGSVSLEIREMQIKATVRYHYIPIRMAKIQNTPPNTSADVEQQRLLHSWWECQRFSHFGRQFVSFLQSYT